MSAVHVAEEQSHISVKFVFVVFISIAARCGKSCNIKHKQFRNYLCRLLFRRCDSNPSQVQNNRGCNLHTSVKLQRMSRDAESVRLSPCVCICACMLNIDCKDYLWRCAYRLFLILILGTRNKIMKFPFLYFTIWSVCLGVIFAWGKKLLLLLLKAWCIRFTEISLQKNLSLSWIVIFCNSCSLLQMGVLWLTNL